MSGGRLGGGRLAPDDLRIRRAEPSDYAAFAATMATPNAYGGTLQMPFPSLEGWRERLAKPSDDHFVVVAEARTSSEAAFEVVGNLGLMAVGTTPRRRHVVSLGVSIRDDWQGRGIGDALMTTAIDRADRWMGVLRIELSVFADNDRAIALYLRHGFVHEGTHRAYALRDGVYVDGWSMARLHPRPPMLPTGPEVR